ncbi:MAG: chromate transporter, partial [Eubacterium sp.]|nr:chromate transporter [Eubacterium sp.]
MPTYWQLFWTFFKLGLFTIGGGMAMIPLMQGIIVDRHHWMTEEEIVDCIA